MFLTLTVRVYMFNHDLTPEWKNSFRDGTIEIRKIGAADNNLNLVEDLCAARYGDVSVYSTIWLSTLQSRDIALTSHCA